MALQESESKTKRERLSNARNATAHISDGPLSCLDLEGALQDFLPPPLSSAMCSFPVYELVLALSQYVPPGIQCIVFNAQ